MSERITAEQYKTTKRYCWGLYSHYPWFCGSGPVTDAEGHVVGVEIRIDPTYPDRFTYVTEHEGVPVNLVHWDLEKHGERYDRNKDTK